MLDQLITIYDIVLKFILEIQFYEYAPEISGFLVILLLLFVAARIRKRRKIRRTGISKKETEPVPELESDVETADDEETASAEAEARLSAGGAAFDAMHGAEAFFDHEPLTEPAPAPPVPEKKKAPAAPVAAKKDDAAGFMSRLKSGLSKTRNSLSKRFDSILTGNRKIDDDVLEEIEEVLITSDIGVSTTMELMQRIGQKTGQIATADEFKSLLKKEMLALVDIKQPEYESGKPHVIMVIGVNGVGKTTTIGKLAAKFSAEGKKVLLSASDTFRAAAVEQLEIWADRSNADIVKHRDKSDPAAVAFDSIEAAIARDIDVVIVDTAGRLHTKVNLMEELKKIKRSISKRIPTAPHETLLVLDATTGQNAVSQARLFNEHISITGIVLTKLDGTAKGGIVISICNSLNVPIRYIGIGEGIDDLQKFNPRLFVDALL